MVSVNCFVCCEEFICPKKFFLHFKSHYTPPGTVYTCCTNKRSQKFIVKYSFKIHVFNQFKKVDNEKLNQTISTEDTLMENCDANIPIPESFSYNDLLQNVNKSINKFVIEIHSNNNYTRSDVIKLQKLIESEILNPIFNFIRNCLDNINYDKETLSRIFCDLQNVFKDFQSDYLLQKSLLKMELTEDPRVFTIENSSNSKGVVMPLRFQFKKIFEKDNCLEKVLAHMDAIEKSASHTDFIQSDLWKQKKLLYPNKTLIPYFLYNDDFGINNPLGSKSSKHSVCNFYYNFPCMPQKSSKIHEVFLECSFLPADIKKYGNNSFKVLIEIIKDIEVSGIDIETKTGTKKVYFVMGLLLGDNLGLNITLNFSKSFSANHFCRFCLINKTDSQKCCKEDPEILRNRINYIHGIEESTFIETGITENSIFNDIPSFHATENYAVDIMHDLYEGICHHILCQSLLHFIYEMKYLTIDILNSRVKSFSYFKNDKGSEKISFTKKELENCKLKVSAKQMMALCYYFPVLLGKYIPRNDEVWKFLNTFFELIEEILCYEISSSSIKKIQNKIEVINRDYQILFKKNLTPKFHIMTHYPMIMKKSGPLRKLWTFKFESKHKQFKIYSNAITSRNNIPKTFSIKHQINFANYLVNSEIIKDCIFTKLLNNPKIKKQVRDTFQCNEILIYSEALLWGYRYDNKSFIGKSLNDVDIFIVICIIKSKSDIFVYGKKVSTIFDIHYEAYEIINILQRFEIIPFHAILGPPVEKIQTSLGKTFVKLKDFYRSIC